MRKKEKPFVTTHELKKEQKKKADFFNKLVEGLQKECDKHNIDAEISQSAQDIIIKTKGRESHILKTKKIPPTGITTKNYIRQYLDIPIKKEKEKKKKKK